ncbi:MAG: toll/interleukin-1 receptor domain-containing protein [Anaerolineales bacterium]
MPTLPADLIFISYSRKDTEALKKIVLFLRNQGFKVWVDNERLIPGTAIWEEEIEKAIKAASIVIVVMSPDSKNSEWVRREISLADQYRKHILPILVRGDEDSSITLRLGTRQFVDLRKDEATGLASLHNALVEHLGETHEQVEEKLNSLTPQRTSTTAAITNDRSISETAKPSASPIIGQYLLWAAIGWAVAGFLAGFIYSSGIDDEIPAGMIGNALGGAIGGFILSLFLHSNPSTVNQKNTFRTILSWVIGAMVGWTIGRFLTEASGAGLGMALFPIIGLVGTLGIEFVLSHWKNTTVIVLTWAISAAIGWLISRPFLIYSLDVDTATSWGIGTALAWAIGGYTTIWQILKIKK